jgi:hypothetical protein
MDLLSFKLTEDQKDWFGNRMTEGNTGSVKVPSHLYNKFRKIYGDELLSKNLIKTYLIDNCYY